MEGNKVAVYGLYGGRVRAALMYGGRDRAACMEGGQDVSGMAGCLRLNIMYDLVHFGLICMVDYWL
jgi:hypothetical protein